MRLFFTIGTNKGSAHETEKFVRYANVVNEMNAIEMLVLTMKRFDDTVFSELAGRFGTGVTRRATGRS